jgi:predicted AAA+ superfamily ATPase
LRDRAGYDLGYRTSILSDLALQPVADTLVLLTGPRRIGKSVALIDLAAQLCERPDVDPRSVIHLPCDDMKPRDLRRALTIARALTRSVDNPTPRRRVWLIDEVGEVEGWTSTIKSARDQSAVGDDTVVLTSSHWTRGTGVASNPRAGRAAVRIRPDGERARPSSTSCRREPRR